MRQLCTLRFWPIIVLVLVLSGCSHHQGFKYVVTSDPIRVYGERGGVCVAIDPAAPTGIWWWGPGRSGCSSRSTVTNVAQENAKGLAALFPAPNATVSTDASGTVHGRFRLGLHGGPGQPDFVDVDLTVSADEIRCVSTQAAVHAKRLDVLDIPLEPPG